MADEIVTNAQNAEATRYDGPPGVVNRPPNAAEQAQLDVARQKLNDMLKGGSSTTPGQRITKPIAGTAVGATKPAEEGQPPQPPSAEKRRVEITKELIEGKLSAEDRAARMVELRQIIAAEGDAEGTKFAELAPEQRRAAYGLDNLDHLEPAIQRVIAENYSDWAADLADIAHAEGLDARTAQALQRDAINLAFQVPGKPLGEDVVDEVLKKYSTLTSGQKSKLKALWRRVEGGGAA